MVKGIEIVDAHMHILTARSNSRIRQRLAERDEGYRRAFALWSEGFQKKYNSELGEENNDPPEKIAQDWAEELDLHEVDKAVFVSLYPEEDELTEVVQAKRERFFAFATVDPKDPKAPELLRRRVLEEGYVGLKLYPTTMGFLPSDRSVYPVYEECRSFTPGNNPSVRVGPALRKSTRAPSGAQGFSGGSLHHRSLRGGVLSRGSLSGLSCQQSLRRYLREERLDRVSSLPDHPFPGV